MIILAPFYKDINPSKEGTEVKEMATIFDYKKNLDRLYHTFNKFNLTGKMIVCTDNKTKLKNHQVFRSNISDKNIMEGFCISNLELLKKINGNIILCGADHLINGNLETMFEDDFHIGLAIVGNPLRINNTIVLVKNNQSSKIIDFFQRRLDCYYQLSLEEKTWFGDQMSYQKILEKEGIINSTDKNLPIGIFNIDGLKIKIFQYGKEFVAPIKKSLPANGIPLVVDFKGPKRKKRIEEIYRYII
jgi:hypothetical protein